MKPEVPKINIAADIRQSQTLPAHFYRSETAFEQVKEKIFAQTWQWVADAADIQEKRQHLPFTFLDGVLDEPLLLTRDKNKTLHCLSNVCTHRGKIIVEKAGKGAALSCGYHGRCFALDGSFKSQVAFEGAENFPTKKDNLHKIPFEEWLGMLFVSLDPVVSFAEMVQPITERLGFLPLDTLRFDAASSKNYKVEGNWALYCDNYLEGLHVPFVHPELNEALDFQNYSYEIHPYCNLQLGIADGPNQPVYDLPEGHPDYGKKVYAYYYWLFPNLMLNFYPFGLSLNIVRPLNHRQTMVHFRTYLYENATSSPEDYALDATEMQDEKVVESVQKGVQSRFYDSGRFSPSHEQAVHHFHRLVQRFMEK